MLNLQSVFEHPPHLHQFSELKLAKLLHTNSSVHTKFQFKNDTFSVFKSKFF